MDRVLAVVNDKEITEGIVLKFLNDMGPQAAMQFQSPEGIKKVVEELVNQELIYFSALDEGLNNDEEFKRELKRHEEGLLKQYAVSKILSDISVSEEELLDYFNNNRIRFIKPESVRASHILVEALEEAEKALEEVKSGLSFADAAKKYSSCPSKEQGGDLGEFTKGQMVPEFEEAAFNMEVGTISEPVKSQFGYHLIQLNEKNDVTSFESEEVKDQLRQQLIGQKQEEIYVNKTNELKDKYKVEFKM